ncbi:hypothetical protein OF83DRAFT_208759 [Amylostereum chailletii]|nr:hypothetical protein OF83DRAFT_208759 [Amylostereum chailletii]
MLKGPLSHIAAGKDEQPSAAETLLLRSIKWTVFVEGTYTTALQTNVILRFFLGRTGCVDCAREKIMKLLTTDWLIPPAFIFHLVAPA